MDCGLIQFFKAFKISTTPSSECEGDVGASVGQITPVFCVWMRQVPKTVFGINFIWWYHFVSLKIIILLIIFVCHAMHAGSF